MFIKDRIQTSIDTKKRLLDDARIISIAEDITKTITESYKAGNKTLWCGNGGSAADAQHLAAELSGRYYFDREPLSSEALHVNTSYLTAVANDYSYDVVYSRLIKALGKKGDVLVGLSTSGGSKNVILALEEAKNIGMITVGFTGEKPSKMDLLCDYIIKIPSSDTPRIQECHMLLGHSICEGVEQNLFGE
ncbi:MAG: D-sedoheptulose 7-phosphate isomerase [Candidatus Paceibacterota bacterium]|jgi:D-sedoheptulose 7-phosphate isomerase